MGPGDAVGLPWSGWMSVCGEEISEVCGGEGAHCLDGVGFARGSCVLCRAEQGARGDIGGWG